MATAMTERLAAKVVTSADWLTARKELLAKEKEFTRLRDELSRKRREMPWERVGKRIRLPGTEREGEPCGSIRRTQPAHCLSLQDCSGMEGGRYDLLGPLGSVQ